MFISADISTDMPACRFIGVITHLRGVRLRAGLAGRGSLAAPALTSCTVHLIGFYSVSHWLAAFIPRFAMRSSRNLHVAWSVPGHYKQRLFIR